MSKPREVISDNPIYDALQECMYAMSSLNMEDEINPDYDPDSDDFNDHFISNKFVYGKHSYEHMRAVIEALFVAEEEKKKTKVKFYQALEKLHSMKQNNEPIPEEDTCHSIDCECIDCLILITYQRFNKI